MKFFKKLHLNFYVLYVCLVLVVLAGVYTANAADAEKRLIGYAWSSNIGWVSFNDGTVSMDEAGNLSGFAWSSNVGWIKFGGLSGFPDSSLGQNAKMEGNDLIGWARVVSVINPLTIKSIDNRGGWDGWISLNSRGKSPNYGVTLNGSNYTGFAWGSDVFGWMDWKQVKVSATDVLCTSANGLLVDGESTTVTTKIASGADKGKCQSQQYICKGQTLEEVGGISAPFICEVGADCEARDGIELKNGESHLFYKERVVSGKACEGQNLTCTNGVLTGADGVADDSYMYSQCLSAPSYKETQ